MSSFTKQKSLEQAKSQVAQYNQYINHFDGWVEVMVTKNVRSKLGTAFVKGDLSIAKPQIRQVVDCEGKTRMFMTVWSMTNRCATSVPLTDITVLENNVALTLCQVID